MNILFDLTEQLRLVARCTNKPIDVSRILRISAEVVNIADPNLLDKDDVAAAIASSVMRKCNISSKNGLDVCWDYGRLFVQIPLRQDEFSMRGKQWELMKNTIENLFNQIQWAMTPAEIEAKYNLSAGTVRQYLKNHPELKTSEVRRPDGRTILMNRSTAKRIWGEKSNE